MNVKFSLLTAGHCTGHEHHVLAGGAHRPCRFPAIVGLIEHPERGLALFDTGYTRRFFDETASGLARLYAVITPVFVEERDTVAAQLRSRGLDPNDVETVILSHFHADHVAGTQDFPNARYVYHGGALRQLQGMPHWKQVRHAFLSGLLPGNFEERALMIESLPASRLERLEGGPFANGFDVFGDGSVLLIELPGHALGHFGALVHTTEADWLMVADSCWMSCAIHENRMPGRVAQFLFPDRTAYRQSLGQLHALYKLFPDLRIVPSHCEEAERLWGTKP